MRREKSIFEAFLTKIKPTIFCLVSKALPLPRLALAFPTGQCGEPLYHRNDLASRQHFSTEYLRPSFGPRGRVFKRYFLNLAPTCLIMWKVSNTHPQEINTYIHTPFFIVPFFP